MPKKNPLFSVITEHKSIFSDPTNFGSLNLKSFQILSLALPSGSSSAPLTTSQKKQDQYYLFDFNLPSSVNSISQNQFFRSRTLTLTEHHLSIFYNSLLIEGLPSADNNRSLYHYTAILNATSGKRYKLHIYFNDLDEICTYNIGLNCLTPHTPHTHSAKAKGQSAVRGRRDDEEILPNDAVGALMSCALPYIQPVLQHIRSLQYSYYTNLTRTLEITQTEYTRIFWQPDPHTEVLMSVIRKLIETLNKIEAMRTLSNTEKKDLITYEAQIEFYQSKTAEKLDIVPPLSKLSSPPISSRPAFVPVSAHSSAPESLSSSGSTKSHCTIRQLETKTPPIFNHWNTLLQDQSYRWDVLEQLNKVWCETIHYSIEPDDMSVLTSLIELQKKTKFYFFTFCKDLIKFKENFLKIKDSVFGNFINDTIPPTLFARLQWQGRQQTFLMSIQNRPSNLSILVRPPIVLDDWVQNTQTPLEYFLCYAFQLNDCALFDACIPFLESAEQIVNIPSPILETKIVTHSIMNLCMDYEKPHFLEKLAFRFRGCIPMWFLQHSSFARIVASHKYFLVYKILIHTYFGFMNRVLRSQQSTYTVKRVENEIHQIECLQLSFQVKNTIQSLNLPINTAFPFFTDLCSIRLYDAFIGFTNILLKIKIDDEKTKTIQKFQEIIGKFCLTSLPQSTTQSLDQITATITTAPTIQQSVLLKTLEGIYAIESLIILCIYELQSVITNAIKEEIYEKLFKNEQFDKTLFTFENTNPSSLINRIYSYDQSTYNNLFDFSVTNSSFSPKEWSHFVTLNRILFISILKFFFLKRTTTILSQKTPDMRAIQSIDTLVILDFMTQLQKQTNELNQAQITDKWMVIISYIAIDVTKSYGWIPK